MNELTEYRKQQRDESIYSWSNKMSIEELSELYNLSETQIRRILKKECKKTFNVKD